MPDGELALYLQADDEEEHRQHASFTQCSSDMLNAVRAPELVGSLSLFHGLGGPAGDLTTRDGAVTEYVSNTIAQLLADFAYARVGRPAVRAVVAFIFHQRDLGGGGPGDCSWPQLEHVESPCFPEPGAQWNLASR